MIILSNSRIQSACVYTQAVEKVNAEAYRKSIYFDFVTKRVINSKTKRVGK